MAKPCRRSRNSGAESQGAAWAAAATDRETEGATGGRPASATFSLRISHAELDDTRCCRAHRNPIWCEISSRPRRQNAARSGLCSPATGTYGDRTRRSSGCSSQADRAAKRRSTSFRLAARLTASKERGLAPARGMRSGYRWKVSLKGGGLPVGRISQMPDVPFHTEAATFAPSTICVSSFFLRRVLHYLCRINYRGSARR